MPTPAPTPTAAAAPEPTVEPPAPAPAAPAPAAPAPFIPESPQPAAPVAPPAVQPAVTVYPDLVPVAEYDAVRVVRAAGTSWNIVGDGYAPGAQIHVSFGPARSDYAPIDIPVVYADANGHYTVTITLAADFTPGSYGVMTVDLPNRETNKRYASVEIVAP